MDLFISDDARQRSPTRSGFKGPLVAAGGLYFPDNAGWIRATEQSIEGTCAKAGFPPGEEFKWSPDRDDWMRDNLKGPARAKFFADVLGAARRAGARPMVVIEDTGCARAIKGTTPEEDVTRLLLERIETEMDMADAYGLVIADRPSGDRRDEDKFLGTCLEALRVGTSYVKHDRIALNVLSTPSHMMRLMQLADLVTSCTLAYVAGESKYAPATFKYIGKLMGSAVGGVGVKIHPDGRYLNLYHWLFGDTGYSKSGVGGALPTKKMPYATNANTP